MDQNTIVFLPTVACVKGWMNNQVYSFSTKRKWGVINPDIWDLLFQNSFIFELQETEKKNLSPFFGPSIQQLPYLYGYCIIIQIKACEVVGQLTSLHKITKTFTIPGS